MLAYCSQASQFIQVFICTCFPHYKLRERFTKVHGSLHNTSVAEFLPFKKYWLMLFGEFSVPTYLLLKVEL